jgi:AcrR family transcriptional regulator
LTVSLDRRPAGRPTKEDTAGIAGRVLDGARAAFCAHGIAGASMEEIAAGAGTTKHTIYRRYPSKMALLAAVVERDLEHLSAHASAATAEKMGALDALRETAWGFFSYGMRAENLCFSAFLTAESTYSEEMRQRWASWERMALAPLLDKIAAAQAAGALHAGDPAELCHLLFDLIEGAANRMRMGLQIEPPGTTAEAFFASRWNVFLCARGLA